MKAPTTTNKARTNTALLGCNCDHDYQDNKYGTRVRVHNLTEKGKDGAHVYRCTVCLRERVA